MAKLVFKSDLSVKGLKQLSQDLLTYAGTTLNIKSNAYVKALAERGITAAEGHVEGEFKPCVEFVFEKKGFGKGSLIGRNKTLIHRVWYTKSGEVQGENDISPILMAEWGAGKYAEEGHRGTFPRHDGKTPSLGVQDKWFWLDESGVKHSSDEDSLMIPTHPMHHAYIEMISVYKEVAKEVFGNE